MFIDTISFFLLTLFSLCSFIGLGIILNRFFFFNKNYNENIFNNFYLSLILIIPISFLNYLVLGNNFFLNIFILILGLIFFVKFSKLKDFKVVFFVVIVLFSGLIISKSHEDFTSYHFQHIREISDGTIKFGLANLDERYFYSSIFSYVQTLFKFKYFDLNLINIPIYLIFLSLVGYLIIEIQNKRNSFICSILLLLIVLKFRRLSEFGYDYIGQFILLYIFLEYIYLGRKNLFEKNIKLILLYFCTILIKVSNIYFLPLILVKLIYKNFFAELFKNKKILILIVPLILTFTSNSFLKTGCFNYLFKDTCIDKKNHSWVFNYDHIENSKKLVKNWSRGYFHQKKNKLTEENYNKNLNWINNWFFGHFSNKILPIIILLLSIIILNKLFIFDKKDVLRKNRLLLFGSLVSVIIWLINFPQYRFGFAGIIIFLIILSHFIIREPKEINIRKLFLSLIIGLIYFNIYNFNRILSEFNREDVYKFTNFPWFAIPQINFKREKVNDILYVRSYKNQHFLWRTCFNSKVMCVNHDDEIDIVKNSKIFFISKK